MPLLASHYSCTGCFTCANLCGKGAITMFADDEGFLMPQIDASRCMECGLCENKCPVLNPLNSNHKNQKAYAIINYADRKNSSSGGAFSLFARYVLAHKGVVFGATIDETFQVFHTKIDNVDDLDKLRSSKYVQSVIGDCYEEVKRELRSGKKVLFTGTPCQVAGLYAFLGKRGEDNLITLDLVCHGVPNHNVFNAYLEKLKASIRLNNGNGIVTGFRFRKLDSWDYRPAVKFAETKWQLLEQEDNAYMSAFFKGLIYRESCFRCQYANLNRVGDFTIADFWGIGRHGIPFKKNVSSGVSLVLDNSGKMKNILNELEKHAYIEERELREALIENENLKSPVERPKFRDSAVKDFLDENFSLLDYSIKYKLLKKENVKYYVNKYLKNIIYTLGLYNVYKTITYKLGK
ncbi:MAG: Coenzyme F420 hydrogenase/dehydrogenase, beta subunit C-terminal domain [Prevotella sp.]|nr:Coenzyme F420 hydrogenase/dehydrogenase, beta subunit C-terminal domain [Prevotella sp.]